MTINKQALLIENGQLVVDTLRHLAGNEIDSDYFAITSTSENGTEIEHELAITDYALQAAGTVDELVKALEAAEKRIAELSTNNDSAHKALLKARRRTVTLPTGYSVRPGHPINETERSVMIPKADGLWLSRFDVEHVLRVAGIAIKGE